MSHRFFDPRYAEGARIARKYGMRMASSPSIPATENAWIGYAPETTPGTAVAAVIFSPRKVIRKLSGSFNEGCCGPIGIFTSPESCIGHLLAQKGHTGQSAMAGCLLSCGDIALPVLA